ncbi:hypothetical protein GIY62_03540 [Burkholderia plantarii]|uniref:hypothetical protein n=1 Tax=Burkholderia plantarii TaxID=41899 RepID=UPI00272C7366|nr:hypothetical protein [Burkholderia plantarii]WLE59760.1 hypothetical protein GIY62_03540 [Burkholderia plantarii]
MREVRALTLKLVSPFGAMEEIVAEAPDNHQHRQEPVAWVVVASVEHRLDHSGLVGGPQVEMLKVVGEGAVGEIALPEIGQLCRVLVRIKRAGITQFVDLCADQVGSREVAHHLRLEETPQEGEIEDCGAIRIGQRLKSWGLRQQPLHTHSVPSPRRLPPITPRPQMYWMLPRCLPVASM